VSRVSVAQLRGFAPGPTQSRLQRWRVVGNVWEIWSARDLNGWCVYNEWYSTMFWRANSAIFWESVELWSD